MQRSLHAPRVRLAGVLLLYIAVAVSVIIASIQLGERLAYELQGPFTADSTIYWAVGRGILNGLVPYRDLFETKPPGIFLLSSLSLIFTGDMRFAAFLQTLIIALFPFLVALGAVRAHRPVSRRSEALIILLALSFGTAIALYTAERSGEFQTESFGALFIVAYAAIIAWDPRPLENLRMFMASVTLFCAIGLKEPFALTALAVAILLAQHPRDLVQSFLKPVLIAGVSGVILMAAIGYLDPYLRIYLPEMLGKHITEDEPLWLRGVHVERLIRDIHAYSATLTSAIVVLIIPAVLLRFRSHKRLLGKIAVISAMIIAIYLLSLSVGTGGAYWNHHFVFAVPGYIALFFVVVREARRHWPHTMTAGCMALVAFVTVGANFTHPDIDFRAKIIDIKNEETAVRTQAQAIDHVLDRCGIDRYLFLGGNGTQPYAFTRHSPLGPLFLQYEYWLDDHRPEFRRSMAHAIERSFFVVLEDVHLQSMTGAARAYLDTHFSEEPWFCANDVRGDDRFRFLYRKSGGTLTVQP